MTAPTLLFPNYPCGGWNEETSKEELKRKEVRELFSIANDAFAQYERYCQRYLQDSRFTELVEARKSKFRAAVLDCKSPLEEKAAVLATVIKPSQHVFDTKVKFFNAYGISAGRTLQKQEKALLEVVQERAAASKEAPMIKTADVALQRVDAPAESPTEEKPSTKPAEKLQQPAATTNTSENTVAQHLPAEKPVPTADAPSTATLTAAPFSALTPVLVVGVALLTTATILYANPDWVNSFLINVGLMEAPQEAPPPGTLESIYNFFTGN